MSSEEDADGRAPANPADIRAQLERILASPEFHAPERGRRFLQYIIEETIEGRSAQLKAYTIAQAVFGRTASFDAQSDPVVRIEAGRIRRALERYYLVCGTRDPIRITIPKGSYSPQFSDAGNSGGEVKTNVTGHGSPSRSGEKPTTYRQLLVPIGVPALFGVMAVLALIRPLEAYLSPPKTASIPAASSSKNATRIAVEPFAALGGTARGRDLAKGLTDQVVARLTRVENLIVLAPGRPDSEADGLLFNLQGGALVEGTVLRLHVRLTGGADGAVLWANQYDRELRDQPILDIEDEIAAEIVAEISSSGKLNATRSSP
jgi:TolB-like protein